jgi:hypothetical protein
MAEITRLSGRSDWIELDFVERERTPSELMQLGIRLHLSGLSLSNTIRELESSVSNGRGKQSMIGCKRPIYSRLTMPVRITLRSTKR